MDDTENKFFAAARKLQQHGFRIFPLAGNTKDQPLVPEFADHASTDAAKAKAWWFCPVMGTDFHHNIGISCKGLIGVDIDDKEGRNGSLEVLRWELQGKDLPDTFEQRTPTGGRHLVYKTDRPIGNSRSKLADGVDIRGDGGYLVGAGSEIDGREYTANFAPIAEAPEWLLDECAKATANRQEGTAIEPGSVDPRYAYQRGEELAISQPGAKKGTRGSTAYGLAAQLKDFGVTEYCAFEILSGNWAPKCDPPMPDDELLVSVGNAYKYGQNKIGSKSPEAAFEPLPEEPIASPVEELNKEYAFVLSGGHHHIIHETTNAEGHPSIVHMDERSFHRRLAAKTVMTGNGKLEPLTKVWMASKSRRTYDGFCFLPGQRTSNRFYNLWRGFAIEPAETLEGCDKECCESFDMFMGHLLDNICDGDKTLYEWLVGYFAHMVQRPWEKPHTAIVFRGRKGVGKSYVLDRIGALIGQHYISVADRRYLIGNFNSHLENCLLINLEEAFWSGDKSADGILKHLITGSHHQIEHKGQEPYKVKNCTRVAIVGNEDWLVPASADERRFAVFNVNDNRIQDIEFFRTMQRGLEVGGYRLLLRHLMDFDLSKIEINSAPLTVGLFDQKIESMMPVHQWWFDCLRAEEIVGSNSSKWPDRIAKLAMRDAFVWYCKSRQIRTRIPDERGFGRLLVAACNGIEGLKYRDGEETTNGYTLPKVAKAREQFAEFIGHGVEW